jgi:alkylation response protein AidB-like acyl-CoA dehydrogenase
MLGGLTLVVANPGGSMSKVAEPIEHLDSFRLRARKWLASNMPRLPKGYDNQRLAQEDENAVDARSLQRTLFEGGFAGLCFPTQYGGQGLTRAHQLTFNEESLPYQMPTLLNVPTFAIIAPTLLEFGTEAQKNRYLPAIIRGNEIWVQFLSEPSGGSDLAGVITRANRDGSIFILNGSKIWSSGAFRSDYALCLARTDWEAPKHRGLTMFIVKIRQPGVTVERIKMVHGRSALCQEFFDDVAIPEDDVLGRVNDGWTVTSRLLHYEREAAGDGSSYVSGVDSGGSGLDGRWTDLLELARSTDKTSDRMVRQLVAESRVNDWVQGQLIDLVTSGVRGGSFQSSAGSLLRLFAATTNERRLDIGLEIAGSAGVWSGDGSVKKWGEQYLFRQGGSLAGGSNEMQRNIISERLLGMPREYAADKDRPFADVHRNQGLS